MADLTSNSWNEQDNLNISPPPNGLPTGSKPSELAPTMRDTRGAMKRFFNRINPMSVSAGTASAFTLNYAVGPTAYVKGETFSFFAHIENTGAVTLDINGLGARAVVRSDGGALTAGQIKNGDIVALTYDGTSFRLLGPTANNPAFTGTITSTAFAGNGAALTNLNGSNISTGTVADARLPATMTGKNFSSGINVTGTATATLFSGSGASLTALNGSNITSGTVADARLPTTMSAKWFTESASINSVASNPALTLHRNGVARGALANDQGSDGLFFTKYSTTGAYQSQLGIMGAGLNDLKYNGSIVWHSGNDGAGSGLDADLLDGQQGSHYLNASNLNAGTISEARLPTTTSQRTYPRRSDGGSINFIWSGQTGQPQWLWGGNDGTNMQVYNPSNFSVAWAANATNATNAVNADTVDGLHASSFMPAPHTEVGIYQTNFPIGHHILLSGYHNRNYPMNVYIAGDAYSYNYSSGTLVSGLWHSRGSFSSPQIGLVQRVA